MNYMNYNKPSLISVNTKTNHLPTSLGLSIGDYSHLKFNNDINENNMSLFKNDENIKRILPDNDSYHCIKALKYIEINHSKIIDKYYDKLIKYNIGVEKKDLTTYKSYTLWNKTIENLLWSIQILEYIKKINKTNISIVEVGCGYADIYTFITIISDFYNINISYTIIDLKQWINKVKQYLIVNNIDITNVSFINYEDLCDGKRLNNYDFFFSKCAYSELNGYIRKFYLDNVVSKCNYVYIIWNYLWNACREHGIDDYFKDKCVIEKNNIFNDYDIVKTKIN